jgi:hypothetical protein
MNLHLGNDNTRDRDIQLQTVLEMIQTTFHDNMDKSGGDSARHPIDPIHEEPLLVIGDFNTRQSSSRYSAFVHAAMIKDAGTDCQHNVRHKNNGGGGDGRSNFTSASSFQSASIVPRPYPQTSAAAIEFVFYKRLTCVAFHSPELDQSKTADGDPRIAYFDFEA